MNDVLEVTRVSEALLIPRAAQGVHGWLAYQMSGKILPLTVLGNDGGGYYIGTLAESRPFSRESMELFTTSKQCMLALNSGRWTQRLRND